MRSCGDLATYTPAKLGIGSAEDDGADVIAETAKPRRLCDTYKKKKLCLQNSLQLAFSLFAVVVRKQKEKTNK